MINNSPIENYYYTPTIMRYNQILEWWWR